MSSVNFKVDVFGPKFCPFDTCAQEVVKLENGAVAHPFVLISSCAAGEQAGLVFIQSVFSRIATLTEKPSWLKKDGSLKKIEYLCSLSGSERKAMKGIWDKAVDADGFLKTEDLHVFKEESIKGLFGVSDGYVGQAKITIKGKGYEVTKLKCTCNLPSPGFAIEIPAITQKVALHKGDEKYGELTLDMIKCLDDESVCLVNKYVSFDVSEQELIQNVKLSDISVDNFHFNEGLMDKIARVCTEVYRAYIRPVVRFVQRQLGSLGNVVKPVNASIKTKGMHFDLNVVWANFELEISV
ncbi:hypothetical protein COB11_03540 [Candidatus Aerophobetes bacterium]|uniref:Uncharacterized protein n=1 Tax=Aerophobetes bacterium TaxID=2030807 RepID=A0A2A4YIP7_UNCAE|nr:MAG: hypothetical protein COB11_03540 [Candidatus Aerophobetes bacterium]